jgi:hypothetical protein
MVSEEKSLAELLSEAPQASDGNTVSLVGLLARSSEPGKFVLTQQDGSSVVLEIASVKEHVVLGTSIGRTIVRIIVEAGKVPKGLESHLVHSIPQHDPPFATGGWWDPIGTLPGADLSWPPHTRSGWDLLPLEQTSPGVVAPFSLATPHQAPMPAANPEPLPWPITQYRTYGGYDKNVWSDGKVINDARAGATNPSGPWLD